jgi:hypothetical protein
LIPERIGILLSNWFEKLTSQNPNIDHLLATLAWDDGLTIKLIKAGSKTAIFRIIVACKNQH